MTPSAERRESAAYVAGCFALMMVGVFLAAGPAVRLSAWQVPGNSNPGFMEAMAWREGRLNLSHRAWDTALVGGRVYSVHPPMFTLLSLAAITLGRMQGVPAETFYAPWYVAAVALPLPLAGFWAFQSVLRRAAWAGLLTGFWIVGTPLLAVLHDCMGGSINAINHALASAGLMLIAGDLLGRRRMWPAAMGLVIAGWSRPTTCAFGVAAILIAWMATPRRGTKVGVAVAALVVTMGTLLALNELKFGNPFETGYRYIYDGKRAEDWYGKRALEYGIFSPHFFLENAYRMNFAPPRFRVSSEYLVQDNDNHGVSIWMTCPLLLFVFVDWRRWWNERAARWLMAASLPVVAAVLMYHTPGTPQVGYFRYALDVLPVWMVVIAPGLVEVRRRGWVIAAVAWSAWYFHMIVT